MIHLAAESHVDRSIDGPAAFIQANIVGTFIAGQSGKWIEKRRGLSLIYFGRSLVFVGFLLVPPSATA